MFCIEYFFIQQLFCFCIYILSGMLVSGLSLRLEYSLFLRCESEVSKDRRDVIFSVK